MRWRTCEEEPCKWQKQLIMLKMTGNCVVGEYRGDAWFGVFSCGGCSCSYSKDDVEKWCPVDEIVSALDAGDSGSELHEKEDNPCSTH